MAKQQDLDEQTPMEAEILREVAEEMKEEQLKRLWKKISPVVTGLIVLALVITGGVELYKEYQHRRSLEEAQQLQTALQLIENGKDDAGAEILKTLSVTSTRGYRYLAAFHYADYLAGRGKDKYGEAIYVLNEIISDKDAPQPFKNLALFDRILLQNESDTLNYEEMEAELDKLATKSDIWAPMALEFSADLALRQGNVEKAKSRWQQILGMSGVSEEKRVRIAEYISIMNSNADKAGK
ncbi:MAG: tetratricopeptide repeat protein [Alphaproteobacteria bacterium]|nr:tetratricopeptide repeat protein [Alphaproteobacteria bacterium]